ncbi:MAG: hypothetical protein ABR946_03925 [Solirubrobacteraceae bacterium]
MSTGAIENRRNAAGFRSRLASPATAKAIGIAALVAPFAGIPLAILIDRTTTSGPSVAGFYLVFGIVFAAVGIVVARRQPRNPIGWLLLGASLAMTLGSVGPEYAYLDYTVHHGKLPLGAIGVFVGEGWVYAFMLLPLIVLLFPDGRAGRLWKWPLRAYMCAVLVYVAGTMNVAAVAIRLRNPVDGGGNIAGSTHPFGSAAWVGPTQAAITVFFGAFCIATVVNAVLSFRRATGAQRQQLKWLGAGGATAITVLIVTIIWSSAPAFVGNVLLPIALTGLPISIGVGILRYRLYEIDRLVSRTLAYALLTGLLVGTFIGLVALTTNTLALSGRVGVAASTLVAAALFNPLRIRIQRLVDRRFNRAQYDAEATVAAFTARLRDAVEIDAIRSDLLDAVNRAVQPTQSSIWIKP